MAGLKDSDSLNQLAPISSDEENSGEEDFDFGALPLTSTSAPPATSTTPPPVPPSSNSGDDAKEKEKREQANARRRERAKVKAAEKKMQVQKQKQKQKPMKSYDDVVDAALELSKAILALSDYPNKEINTRALKVSVASLSLATEMKELRDDAKRKRKASDLADPEVDEEEEFKKKSSKRSKGEK